MTLNMAKESKPLSSPENTNSLTENLNENSEDLMYLHYLKNLEHFNSEECWCCPTLMFQDPDTGMRVYKHYFPH